MTLKQLIKEEMSEFDSFLNGHKDLKPKVSKGQIKFASNFISEKDEDGVLPPDSVSILTRMNTRIKLRS